MQQLPTQRPDNVIHQQEAKIAKAQGLVVIVSVMAHGGVVLFMAYSLSTAVLVRVLEAMPHCMASRGCASVLENDNASGPTHATPRPSMVLTRTMGVVLRANVLFTGGSAAGITPAYTTEWSVS